MDQYLDQRIINTKQNLYAALFDLLKTSTSIKVLDICKKANITPMTFYHHYGDKTQLLQDAINDQLDLRLPIPVKLKPHNLKQLILYLFKFLLEFSLNNKDLIKGASLYIEERGYKNSYLDLFNQTLQFYINNEMRLICNDLDPIIVNMWSETITHGLINLFFKRTQMNKIINFEIVKNSFNLFINKCINPN